jgi:PKD repeat protein
MLMRCDDVFSYRLATGATLNSSTGVFSWTPTYAQSGTHSVVFTVTDSNSATDTETVAITVSNTNRARAGGI